MHVGTELRAAVVACCRKKVTTRLRFRHVSVPVCGFMATIMSMPPRRPGSRAQSRALRTMLATPECCWGRCYVAHGHTHAHDGFGNSSLALAEPEPLTLANLMTKVVDGFDALHTAALSVLCCCGGGPSLAQLVGCLNA